ncbi:acetoacetate--CoA ligase [Photobacterium sanctipauli]|uniref:Acetoacetate--CoA ligase n=1 Tax=Photobacterium sanctipauli TaxID=1342794 RepID=A0A2T3NUM3_9GAMM|nr:acetoacetate--CoA ligase [Photobacterium sanctipauli]PSW19996.1 acetoacetate--CoA ligase [Photobacterium sanctipauli]
MLWMPDKDRIHDSRLYQFMVELSEQQNTLFHDYNQLHQWSVSNSEAFWSMLWEFCNVKGYQQPPISFCPSDSQAPAKDTQWFPNSTLNYAENLLDGWARHAAADAIIFHSEGDQSRRQHLSWQQLYRQTSQVASYLKANGVKQGDVVAGYLPNLPQTIVAMLATTSLGAIWSSTSPDFGTDSVVERFSQTQPKVLFCADGYYYNGKTIDYSEKTEQIIAQLPSLTHVVVIPFINSSPENNNIGSIQTTQWHEILTQFEPNEIHFTPVAFNHPLYILYSSGTTGKPKCITHSVGGTLLNHLKEHQLHCNIQSGDRLFYFTTCGWMMWNWMVSGLASGATLVIYDGSPFYPDGNVLWDMAEQEQVTIFGTSAKYLEALEKQQYSPTLNHPLKSLKTVCSTGSVLAPEQFDYVYQHIHNDIQLASISGGTDICGCFAIGNPISPVFRGECQGRALGMDVNVFDITGKSVFEQQGELVCCNSFPNQPCGFWNDTDGSKYQSAYWDTYPNVWHHGDFVELTASWGMVFYGRSDAVLNPGGVRIGTAEIYRQVNPMPEIVDSLVISQNVGSDSRIVLFVQLKETEQLNDQLKTRIKETIKANCSPRHVPEIILTVNDIPRTKSGKLVELAVRNIVHHQPVKNRGALANPDALEGFKNRPELEQ